LHYNAFAAGGEVWEGAVPPEFFFANYMQKKVTFGDVIDRPIDIHVGVAYRIGSQ